MMLSASADVMILWMETFCRCLALRGCVMTAGTPSVHEPLVSEEAEKKKRLMRPCFWHAVHHLLEAALRAFAPDGFHAEAVS
jgi:hypothetical protein